MRSRRWRRDIMHELLPGIAYVLMVFYCDERIGGLSSLALMRNIQINDYSGVTLDCHAYGRNRSVKFIVDFYRCKIEPASERSP